MVFSSIFFLFFFLPAFFLCYYLVPGKAKNVILLLASIIFYAWGEPKYVILLVISSVVDYINGRMMEKFDGNDRVRKIFLIVSVVINLSLLGIFKYSGLFIDTIDFIPGISINNPNLPLPIGISFFTFQTMSYSIDVYRREVKAEHNFLNYMTYVSMFPQLIAGPIVRYKDVSAELSCRKITFDLASDGFIRFGMGLFKKVIIANGIGLLWDNCLENVGSLSFASAWLGAVAFAFKIYFDFSGYSDMAIGLGKMMGFKYPENFNYPYIADSVTDFWRRWHITLSSWFKSYVYIPLGGSRKGTARTVLNLIIVWGLTGFWHGASWNYLLWGAFFAVVLILEKFVFTKIIEKTPSVVRHIVTIFLILVSWVIFAVEDFSSMGFYLKSMFTFTGGICDGFFWYSLRNYGVILIAATLLSGPLYPELRKRVKGVYWAKCIVFAVLFVISVVFLLKNTYNPFLYFRF